MGAWYYRISVACDTLEFELWIELVSSHLHWCGPLHLAFPSNVAYACTNTQHVLLEEEGDNEKWDLNYKDMFPRVLGY